MSLVKTGNVVHDTNVLVSEGMRQSSVSAATTPAAVTAAEITHARTCLASAIANKCATDPFVDALRRLSGGNS